MSNRCFACRADAETALERELKGNSAWLSIQQELVVHARHAGRERPRKDVSPATHQWQVVATVTFNQERVDQEAFRKACWIVGTNILDTITLSDHALATTYKEQGGLERGFRFLKYPLFLASSVFLKKSERIMALSLIMVLCMLVYHLAEFRLRARLAETEQTIPDQVHKTTARPTLRLSSSTAPSTDLISLGTSL